MQKYSYSRYIVYARSVGQGEPVYCTVNWCLDRLDPFWKMVSTWTVCRFHLLGFRRVSSSIRSRQIQSIFRCLLLASLGPCAKQEPLLPLLRAPDAGVKMPSAIRPCIMQRLCNQRGMRWTDPQSQSCLYMDNGWKMVKIQTNKSIEANREQAILDNIQDGKWEGKQGELGPLGREFPRRIAQDFLNPQLMGWQSSPATC